MKNIQPVQSTRDIVAESRELRESSRRCRAEATMAIEQAKNAVSASERYRQDVESGRSNCWFVRQRPYDPNVCRSVCFCRVIKAIMPAC